MKKNKAPYLKYDRYLAQGFPIATGVIEGACRHLVKDRMDITLLCVNPSRCLRSCQESVGSPDFDVWDWPIYIVGLCMWVLKIQ